MSTALLDAPAEAGTHAADLREIPLAELYESPLNPRKSFDAAGLAELAESLKAGQLNPVLVRPRQAGGYEIAAGHRRRRAAAKAGLTNLLAIVRPMADEEFLKILVVENGQRADLTPIEEAEGFKALRDRAGYDAEAIADLVGKSKEYVYARLKLLELAPEPKKALETGKLTAGHAVLIARLDSEVQKGVTKDVLERQRYQHVSVHDLNSTIDRQVRAVERQKTLDATLAKAATDHPGQKAHRLSAEYYSHESGVLASNEWREVKPDAEGALVGVVIPASHEHQKKPKIVYFVKQKGRSQQTSSHSDWQRQQRERNKKANERAKVQRANLAGTAAVAQAVSWPPSIEVLRAIATEALCRCYQVPGDVALELLGYKPARRPSYYGHELREKLIAKATASQLMAAITFAAIHEHKDLVKLLAKQSKVDLEGAVNTAREEAGLPVQTSTKRLAGDVRREKKAKAKKAGK